MWARAHTKLAPRVPLRVYFVEIRARRVRVAQFWPLVYQIRVKQTRYYRFLRKKEYYYIDSYSQCQSLSIIINRQIVMCRVGCYCYSITFYSNE
jgi:hypothetical protein